MFRAQPLNSNFGVILPSTVIGWAEFSFQNLQTNLHNVNSTKNLKKWPRHDHFHFLLLNVEIGMGGFFATDFFIYFHSHIHSHFYILMVEIVFVGFVRQKLMYSLWWVVGWDKKFVHTFSVSICWWSFAFRLTVVLIIVTIIHKIVWNIQLFCKIMLNYNMCTKGWVNTEFCQIYIWI